MNIFVYLNIFWLATQALETLQSLQRLDSYFITTIQHSHLLAKSHKKGRTQQREALPAVAKSQITTTQNSNSWAPQRFDRSVLRSHRISLQCWNWIRKCLAALWMGIPSFSTASSIRLAQRQHSNMASASLLDVGR
jgi:hypothetical protein